MRNLIKRNLNGKKVLLLFILTGMVYAIMLTITVPKVMGFSGGMKILDMIPMGYDASYVNALFNALGEKGRNAYLFNQLPFDMIFPMLFGISFCLIFAFFLNKLKKLESILFYACFLPLFSGFFDYCENIGIIAMLNIYPDNSNILAQITNVFSILKSSFTTVYFILLIILLIVFGIGKLTRKDKLNHRTIEPSNN